MMICLGAGMLATAPNISQAGPPEVIQKSDLASGIEWERSGINSWRGTRPFKPDMQIGKADYFDVYDVSAAIQIGESRQTPEEWRKRWKGKYPEYSRLPGGTLMEVYPDRAQTPNESAWIIHFWKSGGQGSVKVWVQCDTSFYTKKTLAARNSMNRDFALSECKRLAELVWSRLPEAKPGTRTEGSRPGVKMKVEPIVVVVHGIGFGGTRTPGWSNRMSQAWGLSPLFEVTHNPADVSDSFNWVKDVRRRFEEVFSRSKKEKRPVIIVAHSWGTVMSKLALNGGRVEDGSHGVLVVQPMPEHGWVDLWVTLGSPLQIEGRFSFPGQPTVIYGAGRPPQVKRWSNFYDLKDNVGSASGSLVDVPMNVGLQADGPAFDWYLAKSGIDPAYDRWTPEQKKKNAAQLAKARGLRASWPHIGIWYHPTVRNFIRNQYAVLKQAAETAWRIGSADKED
jgi:hypothetical protein